MKHRLPAWAGRIERDWLPVSLEIPLLNQVSAHLAQFLRVPGLGLPGSDGSVGSRLKFHVNIVTINERRLVVNEQVSIAVLRRLLLVYEGIIDNVSEHMIEILAGD